MKKAIESGDPWFYVADSLEELADKMGVNKANFLKTVEEYNAYCGSYDELFGKYETAVDNESAYEIIHADKQKEAEAAAQAEAEKLAQKQKELEEKEQAKAEREKEKEERARQARKKNSTASKIKNSAVNAVGREIGRSFTRGILGVLKKWF